ncbi:HIT domain-containing protein [Autumnicola psychrophila]|uniref:HIT domain-containing protein n=1 Tax=Autumnicola psychrophila TaxID=3075592 RepID=A0ABU3DPB9_9FLAO|nr:HIT domain-containing protein [Zunongwangia sp. F225]MDT0685565.1 HIT domain-containing protein [Zunongwangia sp. F225]
MSHIYQPVMIKKLLLSEGKAHKSEIAQEILSFDSSQVEYYEKVTNNMVGRVLRSHDIVEKEKNHYTLKNYKNLSPKEIEEIIQLCETKIQEYLKKRGMAIWEHRRRNRKPISGSVRYQVLKRAYGRCELCGVSKEEKALEVDHIVPKNLGGEDSINNYQALCFTCNANKRDTDNTDFRELEGYYNTKDTTCIFCNGNFQKIFENNLAFSFLDRYPVTNFHTLIIPKRHCSTFFDLTQAELNAIYGLAQKVKEQIIAKDSSVGGFNIGFNAEEAAGQTVNHCHMHVIPRRKGDVENPIGGIRNVIAGKGQY